MLGPVLQIAGIALGSELISKLMEETGHGGKVVFVKLISYVAGAYIALDYWWQGVRYVAHMFGVHI